jgi:hypothetical protein
MKSLTHISSRGKGKGPGQEERRENMKDHIWGAFQSFIHARMHARPGMICLLRGGLPKATSLPPTSDAC